MGRVRGIIYNEACAFRAPFPRAGTKDRSASYMPVLHLERGPALSAFVGDPVHGSVPEREGNMSQVPGKLVRRDVRVARDIAIIHPASGV